jgi:hypothetical protein
MSISKNGLVLMEIMISISRRDCLGYASNGSEKSAGLCPGAETSVCRRFSLIWHTHKRHRHKAPLRLIRVVLPLFIIYAVVRGESYSILISCRHLVHIPKFRNGAEKILANASTPDFFDASDIILGYAPSAAMHLVQSPNSYCGKSNEGLNAGIYRAKA